VRARVKEKEATDNVECAYTRFFSSTVAESIRRHFCVAEAGTVAAATAAVAATAETFASDTSATFHRCVEISKLPKIITFRQKIAPWLSC
jgi:hypothetical protein